MRPQPSINTRQMKGVATLGQKPKIISVFKFRQADGAIGIVDQPIGALITHGGDRIDDRLREADGDDVPYGVVNGAAIFVGVPGNGGHPDGAPPPGPAVAEENRAGGEEEKRESEGAGRRYQVRNGVVGVIGGGCICNGRWSRRRVVFDAA